MRGLCIRLLHVIFHLNFAICTINCKIGKGISFGVVFLLNMVDLERHKLIL
nr:hypothetical protein Iba_chr02aCG1320 [Ipomoea batatas]